MASSDSKAREKSNKNKKKIQVEKNFSNMELMISKLQDDASSLSYEESLKAFYDQVVEKGKRPLPTSVIGNAIKNIMQNPKPKTRYVYTKDKFKEFTIPGILPDRTLDRLMAKRLKIKKD